MKTGDKIRIMTSSEYKKYVANHDVPDLFTGTFAEKYMGKQGLIKETYVGTTGVTWCKVSTGRSTYPWPDYMLIKLSDKMQPRISGQGSKAKLGIPAGTLKKLNEQAHNPIRFGTWDWYWEQEKQADLDRARERAMLREMNGEMVIDKEGAKKIKAMLDSSQKYAISSSISAEEMQSGLAAYQDMFFKEVKPKEEKTENPFEVTEKELGLFGLSKMDVLLRAIADPTLEVEVTIRRKKDALTISKSIELHDADSDDLMSIEVNSIEDYWLITKGDEEREKHPKANAIIRFDDGLTGLFRESPIQIRKKIREASLC